MVSGDRRLCIVRARILHCLVVVVVWDGAVGVNRTRGSGSEWEGPESGWEGPESGWEGSAGGTGRGLLQEKVLWSIL